MHTLWSWSTVVPIILGTAAFAHAAEAGEPANSPPNYVVALFSTTVAYRPPHESLDGPQHDISLSLGFGRSITASVALELDAGPTFVHGHYTGFSLVPGVVWGLSSHLYAAGRVLVPVDPGLDVALAPGIGVFHTFDNELTFSLEANVSSAVGRGAPDLGLSLTAGALYSF